MRQTAIVIALLMATVLVALHFLRSPIGRPLFSASAQSVSNAPP